MIVTHALSQAAFDALAAGQGDAAVIRHLHSAQISRRKLQLRLLLDSSGSAVLAGAYALLADATRNNRDLERTVLSQPHFGPWLSASLRRLKGLRLLKGGHNGDGIRDVEKHKLGDPWHGYFVGLAASAGIQAGLDFKIEASSREGSVMLPMLGKLLTTDARIVISHRDGRTTLGHTVLPRDPAKDAPGWQGLRAHSCTSGGLTLRVWLDDVDPFRGNAVHPTASRLMRSQVREWRKLLDAAWPLLVRYHRGYAEAIAEGLRALVPLHTVHRTLGANVTNRDAFGSVAMTTPASAEALAVGLVHEFQHGKLYALNDIVKLHEHGDDEYYYTPWRDDPRPLGAALQGAYAFLGVTNFWRVQRRVNRSAKAVHAEAEFARWRDRVRVTTRALMGSPSFTPSGRQLISGMWAAQEEWSGEQVSTTAAELARAASEDHWMGWRLRNRRPDQLAIEDLCRCWLAGKDCPKGAVSAEVIGTKEVLLASSARLELSRLRTLNPSRFFALCGRPDRLSRVLPEASAGDLALVCGKFEQASRHYRSQILDGHGGINPWIGLALAGLRGNAPESALSAAPELCLALHRRLCDSGHCPDPIAIGDWLAPMSVAAPDRS
ncbi:MAG TPA: HEXXH motif domain-containing protein [Candidatus Limnocylindrales bacterium]|nr:HEXXH motif domain-containing protein [Candidatus Limnocylindrales bacterium]